MIRFALMLCVAVPVFASISDAKSSDASAERELGSGQVSYYAREFAGQRIASGEAFNPGAMTCAHRTARFGSRIRVTNTSNGKQVIVRVNDRGPHIEDNPLCALVPLCETTGTALPYIDQASTLSPFCPQMPCQHQRRHTQPVGADIKIGPRKRVRAAPPYIPRQNAADIMVIAVV
jgi:Lytic transglycolase